MLESLSLRIDVFSKCFKSVEGLYFNLNKLQELLELLFATKNTRNKVQNISHFLSFENGKRIFAFTLIIIFEVSCY